MSVSVNPGTLLKIASDIVPDPVDAVDAHRQLTRGQSLAGDTNAAALHHACSRLTVSGGAATLGADATRCSVTLKAPLSNVADIVLESSGAHLERGASITIAAVDAFAFSGTNGDVIDVIQVHN